MFEQPGICLVSAKMRPTKQMFQIQVTCERTVHFNHDQKQKPFPTLVQFLVSSIFQHAKYFSPVESAWNIGLLEYYRIFQEPDAGRCCHLNLMFSAPFATKVDLARDSQICARNLYPPHVFCIFLLSASFIACNLPSIYDLLFAISSQLLVLLQV